MLEGFSVILDEFVSSHECDTQTTKQFQVVCPFCEEEFFWAVDTAYKRQGKIVQKPAYFSHKRTTTETKLCEARAATPEGKRELEALKAEQRVKRQERFRLYFLDYLRQYGKVPSKPHKITGVPASMLIVLARQLRNDLKDPGVLELITETMTYGIEIAFAADPKAKLQSLPEFNKVANLKLFAPESDRLVDVLAHQCRLIGGDLSVRVQKTISLEALEFMCKQTDINFFAEVVNCAMYWQWKERKCFPTPDSMGEVWANLLIYLAIQIGITRWDKPLSAIQSKGFGVKHRS